MLKDGDRFLQELRLRNLEQAARQMDDAKKSLDWIIVKYLYRRYSFWLDFIKPLNN